MPRTKQTARKPIPSRATRPEPVHPTASLPVVYGDRVVVPVTVLDHSTLCSFWGFRTEKLEEFLDSARWWRDCDEGERDFKRLRELARAQPSFVEEKIRCALVAGLCFCRDSVEIVDFVLNSIDA